MYKYCTLFLKILISCVSLLCLHSGKFGTATGKNINPTGERAGILRSNQHAGAAEPRSPEPQNWVKETFLPIATYDSYILRFALSLAAAILELTMKSGSPQSLQSRHTFYDSFA